MQKHFHFMTLAIACVVFFLPRFESLAADWPTYRGDANRSGFTTDRLPEKLSLHWSYQSSHAPQPAWPRSKKLRYDRANHCVIAGERVFFGDSVTGKVHALDLNSGKQLWEFATEGADSICSYRLEGSFVCRQ